MAPPILDYSNTITIEILGAPSLASAPNINTCALFTLDPVPAGWSGAPYMIYTGPAQVSVDFGSTSNTAILANYFFAQQPNPTQTDGYLVIIPLQGSGSETVQAAIVRTLNLVYYFGVLVPAEYYSTPSILTSLATFVQGLDKVVFYASSQSADVQPGGLIDLIRQSSDSHTRTLYFNDGIEIDTQGFAASYAGLALSTNFAGVTTTQTMNLKSIAGIGYDTTLNQTLVNAVLLAGADCYANQFGTPTVLSSGRNMFWDQVYNSEWFKFALQAAAFNFLRSNGTKIPQTEKGMTAFKNALRQVCGQGVTNGFLAPGAWTGLTFGNPTQLIQSVASNGYYVYSEPVADQDSTDRANRIAPTIQIAAAQAGAIHSANIIVQMQV